MATERDLKGFARMEWLIQEISTRGNEDVSLIAELITLGFLHIGHGSLHSWQLQSKLKKYRELKQPRAKARIMEDIHREIRGVLAEMNNCR
jgi:hypothetical protein